MRNPTGQECSHLAAQSCEGHHGPGPSLFWRSHCLVSKEVYWSIAKNNCKNALSKQFLQRVWLVIICPGFVINRASSDHVRVAQTLLWPILPMVVIPLGIVSSAGVLPRAVPFYICTQLFFLTWTLGQLQMFEKRPTTTTYGHSGGCCHCQSSLARSYAMP